MTNEELIAEARGIGNWTQHETGPRQDGRTGPTLFARLVYALEAAESRIDSILDADPPVSRIEEMHAAALNRAISAEAERDTAHALLAKVREWDNDDRADLTRLSMILDGANQ